MIRSWNWMLSYSRGLLAAGNAGLFCGFQKCPHFLNILIRGQILFRARKSYRRDFILRKWYLGQLSQGSSWAQRILDKKSAAIKYLKGALPIIGSPPVWDTGTVPDSYISGTGPGQGWEFNFSRHQTCQMMRLMLLRYWWAIQNQVNLTARTVLHLVTPPNRMIF